MVLALQINTRGIRWPRVRKGQDLDIAAGGSDAPIMLAISFLGAASGRSCPHLEPVLAAVGGHILLRIPKVGFPAAALVPARRFVPNLQPGVSIVSVLASPQTLQL